MTRYVAFVRGVGPTDPRMSNHNLRGVCERLGLAHVSSLLTSGNLVFEAESDDQAGLESRLEAAWSAELGFERATIVRSHGDLEALVAGRPFGDLVHGPRSYLLVTFAKGPIDVHETLPYRPAGHDTELVASRARELFTVTDLEGEGRSDVMVWLERCFGRDISSRTWLTVERILRRMAKDG